MARKMKWLIALSLILLALLLRLYQFENYAPFDWDQARDYSQVTKIARGDLVILGPVAKGEGGFYLGSLYYYLLYPTYVIMRGSLSALPVTSIILDSIVPGLIFLLLSRFLGRRLAISTALFWVCSAIFIDTSRISWNVALIPIWSILSLTSLLSILSQPSKKWLYFLAILTGISVHIHVATIPLIPLLLYFNRRHLTYSLQTYLYALAIGVTPILPLIIFDITHSFQNLHLFLFQFRHLTNAPVEPPAMLLMLLTKLGKVISGLFLAKFADSFWLGLLATIVAAFSLIDRRLFVKISAQIVLSSIGLVLALHDYHFPEYYFAPAYLALIILFFAQLKRLLPRIGWLILVLTLLLNFQTYRHSSPGGFSLGFKQNIVEYLSTLPPPRDIHFQFDPGRDGGLRELIELANLKTDPSSLSRIILTDRVKYPAYIDGELAFDIFQSGDIKIARYIVQ